jgi:hypothetical protein
MGGKKTRHGFGAGRYGKRKGRERWSLMEIERERYTSAR